jgi:phosphate/sulfate permease
MGTFNLAVTPKLSIQRALLGEMTERLVELLCSQQTVQFRRLQLISAATYSLGHGTNDAQKGMGIITAALITGGMIKDYYVPYWVIICCHLAMGAAPWPVVGASSGRWASASPN